ncbi:MAG: hypothetical protein QXO21_06340, partial [Candidatus Anstonellales archaeon]
MFKLKTIFLALLVFFILQNLYSAHTTFLLSSRLLGGGYGFNQESTSFGGRLNINVIPAVKWKENLLIPVYSLEYNGVKDVKELQQKLNEKCKELNHSSLPLQVDGIFGLKTLMRLNELASLANKPKEEAPTVEGNNQSTQEVKPEATPTTVEG